MVRQLLDAGLLDRPSNRGPSLAETTAESTPAAIATGQSAISGTSAAFGCELGSLASELADQDEGTRAALAQQFANWEELLGVTAFEPAPTRIWRIGSPGRNPTWAMPATAMA